MFSFLFEFEFFELEKSILEDNLKEATNIRMKSLAFTLSIFLVLAAMMDVDAMIQSLGPKMNHGDQFQQLQQLKVM